MAATNIEKATALLRAVASGDADLAIRHVSPDGFVQHDPLIADGPAGLCAQASRATGDDRPDIVRVLEDGPFVVVHGWTGVGDEGEVFFAVFRFADGLLVEHWRFAAPVAPPNASGHSQTDGPTESDGNQDTDRTKALVRDYYETVHLGGQHDRIYRYMADGKQIRHEPGVRDGVAAFTLDLAVLVRSKTIDAIVLFAGQGDLVFIAARGTHDGEPCAYIDLYRVAAGKLVEHWGFPQAIPPREAWMNSNGLI
ncbi:nuclear transport factor 2 family protein [Lichenibacterium ramalinae]|uniref:SnoaL-like domain-containing protein n=1 Tax=Lichenibacterium ramalinae TaxID=2316527 RepID=A0A4Q2R7N7_9HYPH|nr:nuclear transport factor 2 family protein [Lichenibacterium ramalinae]RYB01763.1 hypothetical protein D3272_24445 [Lichenibacterium ramalinae]